jgi:hypothetical protein
MDSTFLRYSLQWVWAMMNNGSHNNSITQSANSEVGTVDQDKTSIGPFPVHIGSPWETHKKQVEVEIGETFTICHKPNTLKLHAIRSFSAQDGEG